MSEVSGTLQVITNLKRISIRQQENLIEAVEVTQALVSNDAKSIVPVDTGFLQNSIQPGEVTVGNNVVDGEVRADAEYAAYVENGTSRQKAQPFMFPALKKNKENFKRRVAKAMEDA